MNRLRRKYLVINALLALIIGVMTFLSSLMWDAIRPSYLILSLIYFAIYQLGFIFLASRAKKNPKQLPMILLLSKGLKFILLVVLAAVYCALAQSDIRLFLVLFASYYIVWLIFDTIFFYKNSKNLIE